MPRNIGTKRETPLNDTLIGHNIVSAENCLLCIWTHFKKFVTFLFRFKIKKNSLHRMFDGIWSSSKFIMGFEPNNYLSLLFFEKKKIQQKNMIRWSVCVCVYWSVNIGMMIARFPNWTGFYDFSLLKPFV